MKKSYVYHVHIPELQNSLDTDCLDTVVSFVENVPALAGAVNVFKNKLLFATKEPHGTITYY
jgi:hypothetical protein